MPKFEEVFHGALSDKAFNYLQVIYLLKEEGAEINMDKIYTEEFVLQLLLDWVPEIWKKYPDLKMASILFKKIEMADSFQKWNWEVFDNKIEFAVGDDLEYVLL